MKKVLLLGKNGQLGFELNRVLSKKFSVIGLDRNDLDLERLSSINSTLKSYDFDILVNAAAYTQVDRAETERDKAHSINALAPGILAEACKSRGKILIHYSTDYVFDGTKQSPYLETDQTNPINVYGQTKRDGEIKVLESKCTALIFRTSWVYSLHGNNFLKTMLRLGQERNELRIVNDQRGAPTWTRSIAEATCNVLLANKGPEEALLFHMTNSGSTTWYGFAEKIFEGLQKHQFKSPQLIPILSAEYKSAAKRPINSELSNELLHRTLDVQLENWASALEKCLAEFK